MQDGVLNEAEATLRSKMSYSGGGDVSRRRGFGHGSGGGVSAMDWGAGAVGVVVGSDGEPLAGDDCNVEDGTNGEGEGSGVTRRVGVRGEARGAGRGR